MTPNPIVEIIRAIARPAISVIFAAVIAEMVIEGITAPEWFLALAIPCITWWFAERAISHAKEASSSNGDALAQKVAKAVTEQLKEQKGGS
jgi:hypothetical protein